MRGAFFCLSLWMFFPVVAWAADSVEVRIAVVLAKAKDTEATQNPQAFPGDYRRKKCEKHGNCQETEVGDSLDAEDLRPMQKALARRRHYGWFKRFSKKRATIDAKGETVELPGGAKAHLRLKELKNDVATLVVSLPDTETTYQLGRAGSLYLQAGKHEEKEIWVVISPKKHFH